MKTAEAKHTSPTSPTRSGQPFFQQNGKSTFFSDSQTALQTKPFFSKKTATPFIQAKLTIGQPGDRYEKEADAMADRVVQRLSHSETVQAGPETLTTPAGSPVHLKSELSAGAVIPPVQPKCASCEKEEQLQKQEEEDRLEEPIQRKPVFESSIPPADEEIQRMCAECEAEEKLQKKGEADSSETVSSFPLENSLNSTRGSGSPLPEDTRTQMESSFGTDFSNVRIHTGSSAVRMNQDLHAQAFTHGSDIYFNSGKYNPESTRGKKLLAHELTHTVQQGGAGRSRTAKPKIQRWPDWVSDAAGWVSDTASDVAGGVVEGAEWVGGKVRDGAQWVGGKVAAGAEWVGEQISAAGQWIIDQIRSVIQSGTNYLNEKWESIKKFGRTCFEDIKNGFGNLINFVTTPLTGFISALSIMDADLLGSIWNLLKTGANALWAGINSVINGVLQIGHGIWNTVSGFINGIFDTIAGLFDNAAFDLLPNFIKSEVRSILNGLRTLWNQISSFWTDLWQRLTSSIQEILVAVRSFADNVTGFVINKIISMVRGLREVYDYVTKFFADPQATIQPYLDALAEKLNDEVPPGANNLGTKLAQENYVGDSAQTADNDIIQRVPEDSEDRKTATLAEVLKGIVYYVARAWAELNIKQLLWQTVVNMFWPPATIRAIGNLFSQLWNDHWATTVDSLYGPRNFFDDPIGCLQDIWSNFLILLDFPLSLWRTLNNVVGLLMGYITIILVLVYAIAGGIAAAEVGVVPGLLAGALLGLETAAVIGEALMVSYVLAEGLTVEVILVRLFTARQVCEKRQVDILTSVASFIAMAVALALQLLMALLAELVSLIANLLKGAPKPAPVPQPRPSPQPVPQPLPPPQPRPVPAPQPQPIPAQPRPVPVQPVQPAPPGGGQVIPFPARPVTPSQPGQIAAKFDGALHPVSLYDASSVDKPTAVIINEPDAGQESAPDIETSSEVHGSGSGILQAQQTSRSKKIDPDACEPQKKICYEKSVTFDINPASMNFVGVLPTPDDLRIASCLLRTATGTTSRAFSSLNVAIGKFLVNDSYEYIPGVNIPRGNIHSEDIILIEANRRFGPGNYKLAALFSERVPCPRCSANLRGTPLTPDCRIYCIINNDYDWRSIRRSYNDGRLI